MLARKLHRAWCARGCFMKSHKGVSNAWEALQLWMEVGEYPFSYECWWWVLTSSTISPRVCKAFRHSGRWETVQVGLSDRIYIVCDIPTCFLVTIVYYCYKTPISIILRDYHIPLIIFKPLIGSTRTAVEGSAAHLLTVVTTCRLEM